MTEATYVAEVACSALHTELVTYVVDTYAAVRAAQDGPANSVRVMTSGDVVYHTLENIGVHAGLRLAERLLCSEPLSHFSPEVVSKFIAGPVWFAIFGKGAEHKHAQDIAEICDRDFRWIAGTCFRGLSAATGTVHTAPGFGDDNPNGSSLTERDTRPPEAGPADFVVYSCGLIRGVLHALSHPHVAVSFQILGTADDIEQGPRDAPVTLSEVRFMLDFRGERVLGA